MDLNLIVACDLEWNIGLGNKLLFRISEDLKRFKRLTVGHPVVYGRRTLESFPKGKPLAERPNIVLSRNQDFQVENATVVHNLDELFAVLRQIGDPVVSVIGGGEVFRQLLPYCRTAEVTRVLSVFLADVHFPNLDRILGWSLVEQGDMRQDKGLAYRYDRYENRSPWPLPAPEGEPDLHPADQPIS